VSSRKIGILLVDDEADHVELIQRALSAASFDAGLSVVGSLAEAQTFLKESPPDIVIADYHLPDGNGLQLLPDDVEKPTIPIIILTGHGDEKVAAAALKAGALDYVVKSDETLNDVAHIVERGLREWKHIADRRQAETVLSENAERLQLALGAANQAWFDANIQTGEIQVSPEYAGMIGYDSETFKSSLPHWMESLHPDDRDAVMATFQRCLTSGGPVSMEYRRKTKSGGWTWMSSTGKIVEWDDAHKPLRMIGIHTNISERKQAEALLLNERERIISILNKVGDPIFVKDNDHRLVLANHAFFDMFGMEESAAIGKTLAEQVPANERQQFLAVDRKVLDTGISDQREESLTLGGITRIIITRKSRFIDRFGEKYLVGSIHDFTERKEAEAAVLASEEKFRATFNQAAVGIAHLTTDGGWVKVNDRLCDIVGYSRDELMHLTFQDITHPDDLELDLSHVNELLAGDIEHYSMEKRYIRKSGETIWINLTASLVRQADGSPDYFISVVEDINQRKQAELLVEKTGKMAHVGGWELDIETMTMLWTEEVHRIHEVPMDYTPPLADAINFYAPEDRPVIQQVVQRAIDDGTPYDVEVRFITAKGKNLWVHALGEAHLKDGKPFKLSGTFQDITERKEGELVLREKKAFSDALINTAQEVVVVLNPDASIRYINPYMEALSGFKLAEVEGKDWFNTFLPKKDWSELRKLFGKAIGDVTTKGNINPIISKSGDERLIEWHDTALKDAEGGVVGLLTIGRDVTERKQAEQKIKQGHRLIVETEEIGKVGGWEFNVETSELKWTDEVYKIHELEVGSDLKIIEAINFYTPESRPIIEQAVQRAIENNEPYDLELGIITAKGNHRYVHAIGRSDPENRRVYGFFQDITERKHAESALQAVFESTVMPIRQDFFAGIVGSLCDWLEADCAIVSEIVSEGHVRALAMQLDGKAIEDYEYDLIDTPCAGADELGFCAYAEGVCEAFPKDKELIDMNAEGYFGVALRDKSEKTIGILCVISRKKLNLPPKVQQVFEIIAARAAVEIERLQAEERVRGKFDEIERMNKLMIGREMKMEELRQEIKRLKGEQDA